MNIRVHDTPTSLIVHLHGALTASTAVDFAERLHAMCPQPLQKRVVLDLQECETIESLGFGALITFRLSPGLRDQPFAIRGASPTLLENIKGLHLDSLFLLEDHCGG